MKHMQVWNIIQFSYQSFKSPLSASLFTHVSLKIYLGWHTALTFRDITCICCGKVSESLIDLTAQTLRTFYFYSFLQSFCWDLCQHYYVATATAHNFVCSLSVGRDDSHDWLHAHQRPMLRLSFVLTPQNDLWPQNNAKIWKCTLGIGQSKCTWAITDYWHNTVHIVFMCTCKQGEIWHFHCASSSATC